MFRRHVRKSPAESGLGVPHVGRQVKVEQPRLAVHTKQDVRWLEIVVNVAALMNGRQGVGHAHAGVLLVLSLAYFVYLGRAGYSTGLQWLAGALLLAGVLAQSGGFFVHLGLGQQGRSSPGTALTRGGALLIAAALIILAVGLITHG